MKHMYRACEENTWEIVYTSTRVHPATRDDPAWGGEIEIEEVWLMGTTHDGKRVRVFDINPHLRGEDDLKAIFGKYIYETLAAHAADDVADEAASAAEYRNEARRDGGV